MKSAPFWIVASLTALMGCATRPDLPCQPAPDLATPCRPFRAGVMKMQPGLDEVKPVAPFDPAGWVLMSDLLIGPMGERAVGARSMKTGELVWWLDLDEAVATPVTPVGSWVMVGLRDGSLMKVEALTGKKVWETKLGRFILSPLTLSGATLLGVTAHQQLYSIDFQNGATNWIYDAGSPETLVLRGNAAPKVLDQKIFLGTSNGELHVVNLEDGSLAWRVSPGVSEARFLDVVGELVVEGHHALLSRYDGIVAQITFEGLDRRVSWKEEVPNATTSTYHDGIYYVGSLTGAVTALDGATGRKLWTSDIGQAVNSITVGEKIIYIAGTDGRIAALGKEKGEAYWFDDIGSALFHQPLISGNTIYFASGMKVLYGYQM